LAFILKKLTAILLLTVFLFNIIGYKLVYHFLQQASDQQLHTLLDKNLYNEAELIAIKIPLSLPYQNDQKEFERVDGEINFSGKIYKYVKRKISGGNLVLMCLPDYNKMRLKKQKDDFDKNLNGIAQTPSSKKQDSKSNSLKNVLNEYDESNYQYFFARFGSFSKSSFFDQQKSLSTSPHLSPEQPPELI
jgi:hypothetical protein